MKVAVLCAVCCVLAIALSQPTDDPEQQELCEGVCQQDDLNTLQNRFTTQITAIRNDISQLMQLKAQVERVLQLYNGGSGGNPRNGTQLPPPTSPSGCYLFMYLFITFARRYCDTSCLLVSVCARLLTCVGRAGVS